MKSNKIIAGIMAVCLVGGTAFIPENLPVVPTTAVAESDTDISWTLENGILTISGTGDMPDYEEAGYYYPEYPQDERYSTAPWGEEHASITEIVVEDGITGIGRLAFYNCMNLKKVTLPDSVTKIGALSFERCKSMDEIEIPENVTSIGGRAFEECNSITALTIPDTVTEIGAGAFSDCTSLESIVIPDGITVIRESTFSNCDSLTSITIPDSVTTIASGAVAGCDSLTSIDISEYVTELSFTALDDNNNLTDINISENNPNYSSEDGVIFDKDKTTLIMYSDGRKDKSYIVPDTVTTIGQRSFDYCDIESVVIPDSVTIIEYGAFWDCESLQDVKFSQNLESMGKSAFYNCTSLKSVDIPSSLTTLEEHVFYYSGLTSAVIPEGITTISECAFGSCPVESVVIPDSVEYIGKYAFSNCKFESITLSENVKIVYSSSFSGEIKEMTILNPECAVVANSGSNSKELRARNKIKYTIYGYKQSFVKDTAVLCDWKFIAIDDAFTTLIGDVNFDGKVNISDSVIIMQSISNPDDYQLSRYKKMNADTTDRDGGVTLMDALAVQLVEANIISQDDLPITSEQFNELIKS